ncbi:MAG: hypothetical protein BWY06_02728 [Candidatus Latescibacteria bacterium ADurb.Bin168]|nr:MAG: hypothetical protein BWY06_02728 [Candidatus Latescibacteria bacterium ADurb.Bin168]
MVHRLRADRERGPEVLVVVETEVTGRREKNLIVVAAVDRHVGPVEHGLDCGASVHENILSLQDGTIRQQRKADRPFEAATEFGLADPDRFGAVRVRREFPVNRHRGRRAVVVWKIPLHAAGDPGAEHADQRGFHDVLPVEGLETGVFIREVQQVAAVFGQEAHLQPTVLEGEVFVSLIQLHVVQHVLHGIRIHAPLRALVDAAGVEHRCFVIPSRRIGRQRDGRFFDAHPSLTHRRAQTNNAPENQPLNSFHHNTLAWVSHFNGAHRNG